MKKELQKTEELILTIFIGIIGYGFGAFGFGVIAKHITQNNYIKLFSYFMFFVCIVIMFISIIKAIRLVTKKMNKSF